MSEKFAPVHPGEILLEEFLKPMKLSQYALAKDIAVPARRASMKSYMANAPSVRIPPCDCRGISGCPRISG